MSNELRIEQREWTHESPPGREDCRGQLRWVVFEAGLHWYKDPKWVHDHFATEGEAQSYIEQVNKEKKNAK